MKPTVHTTDTSTLKRAGTLGIFAVVAFAFLLLRILALQTVGYEKYRDKVLNQITTEAEVVAERGYSISGEIVGGTGTTLPGFGSESDDLIYEKNREARATEPLVF